MHECFLKEKLIMQLNIQHYQNQKEFAAEINGKKAVLQYEILNSGKVLDYYHTFVPPELRGQKIGEQIVKFALDYARDNHLKVIPSCPFVQHFIDRHSDYQNLVANGDAG